MDTNTIYCGDNLEVLSKFPDESIDLIYADPPFFSNRDYDDIWKDVAVTKFKDKWKGGMDTYQDWMEERLAQCHRILKLTGSMYLHCDWHANAHLRILMDKIFGESNFQNEIIWHYHWGVHIKKRWNRKHDTILFYSRTNKWYFTPEFAREPYSEGSLMTQDTKWNKSYNQDGRLPEDVWYIPTINAVAKERLGYPTQKPEALLRRIIEASSNKGDTVLDPFCGCGTTISVANKLERKWIGIDVSPTACKLMQRRLNLPDSAVAGMPTSIEDLKTLEPFEFQNWVLQRIQGTVNSKKSADGGVDGWTLMNRYPIQVKQSDNIGRNKVDEFEAAIERSSKTTAYFYAFSFSKGAYGEASRVNRTRDWNLQLITIEELINEEDTHQ